MKPQRRRARQGGETEKGEIGTIGHRKTESRHRRCTGGVGARAEWQLRWKQGRGPLLHAEAHGEGDSKSRTGGA